MKTYKNWEKSNKDLDDFLNPLEEIDEELYLYIIEIVPPYWCYGGFGQNGEPTKKDKHCIYYRDTVMNVNGRYYYLGVLPEFKQPD